MHMVVKLRSHPLVAPSVEYCQTSRDSNGLSNNDPSCAKPNDKEVMVAMNDMFNNYMMEHGSPAVAALHSGLPSNIPPEIQAGLE